MINVPQDYKQTEVGVIPEDWEVYRVRELVKHGPKNGYSGRSGKDIQGTPTLSLSATSNGHLVLNSQTIKYLEERVSPDSDLFLKPGDILVQRSNTTDLVGTTAIFTGPPATFIYPDLMMRLRFKERASANWFWRYANSTGGRRFFTSVAAGSTGSMPKISGEKLREMPIPAPPLPEQEAIAGVLSDTDGLIESLEQLIAKKRRIKQGAMQELLTGKKRLPGFSGEWEVKRLGDVADIDPDNLGSATPANYTFNYISLEDVDLGSLRSYSEQVFSSAPSRARRRLKAGDILVSTVRPNLQSHLLFTSLETNWICSTGFSVVRCKTQDADPGYIYCHFFGHCVTNQIETLITGSNYPAINGRDVKALEIPIPKLSEQTAIAAILSAMDAEITTLETRLAKTRSLKQGMMHNLLTGRIRLL